MAVVGCGTIGASWAALFMAHGLDVSATDLRPEAEDALRQAVAAFTPSLKGQLNQSGGRLGSLSFTLDIEACCRNADFIQENATERLDQKVELMSRIDAASRPDVVIASSSSAIGVSDMQRSCVRSERVILGHPFNPPHLVPLVELVGGKDTENWALDKAEAFYRSLGKTPIRLNKEVFGHVANRLQAAVFREAVSLLRSGVATASDIDKAVTEGPGLRWALMGPFLTYHLAGGRDGIRGFMSQFSPMQRTLWAQLDHSEFNAALQQDVVSAVEAAFAGHSIEEFAEKRDRRIEALLRTRSEDLESGSAS
ncbi:3-hydroxyacyl-CoA dehydrogenase NAD-binding domain-containing protein [Agrobacterium fabacearum]|nr:3-hydroxyacyl-CoA dehydrogenase NAD-binding domain-containing protein [Agrobacterium tumefaciens]